MKTITTKTGLATKLKLSRTTLDRYLAMPHAPAKVKGAWDFDAVLAFVASHADKESTSAKVSTGVGALKSKEIALRCERMRFHLDRDRGRYVLVETSDRQLHAIASAQLRLLRSKLEGEYPAAVAGMDPAQARVFGKRLCDDICGLMRGIVAKFPD